MADMNLDSKSEVELGREAMCPGYGFLAQASILCWDNPILATDRTMCPNIILFNFRFLSQ